MSDGDDDGNSYSSDGESNDDNSYDDEYDNSLGSPEISGVDNLRLQDEEERQHSRSESWNSPRSRGNIAEMSQHTRNGRNIANYVTGPSSVQNGAHAMPRRGHGRTSYVSLVKQTEDEMELVRRRQGIRPRHGANTSQLHGATQREKFKAKTRSANAVTLLFGRGRGVPHAAQIVHSTKTTRQREKSGNDSSDTEVSFPLREIAAGESDKTVSAREAKSLENAAKRKAKSLKAEVGLAKLDVAEAKLSEFAATLEVRQAKIEERQAKLVRRRAALKQAEEEQTVLESKMDAEEEDQRSRERRIKNRERRMRQEEAGLRLKEASLRKREQTVSQGIEKIEQWRQIVDEKEEMQKRMEEIVEKKEELHGRDVGSTGVFGTLGRKLKLKKNKNAAEDSHTPRGNAVREQSKSKFTSQSYPTPKARSSLNNYDHRKNSKVINGDTPPQKGRDGSHQQKSTLSKNEVNGCSLSLWL